MTNGTLGSDKGVRFTVIARCRMRNWNVLWGELTWKSGEKTPNWRGLASHPQCGGLR